MSIGNYKGTAISRSDISTIATAVAQFADEVNERTGFSPKPSEFARVIEKELAQLGFAISIMQKTQKEL